MRVGKPDRVTHVGFKMGFFGGTESKETIRHAPTSARTRPSLLSSRPGCVPSSGWTPCIPLLPGEVRMPRMLEPRYGAMLSEGLPEAACVRVWLPPDSSAAGAQTLSCALSRTPRTG